MGVNLPFAQHKAMSVAAHVNRLPYDVALRVDLRQKNV